MSSPDITEPKTDDASVDEQGRPDFEIGLALAGAISAGAYTAGVIDFLVQALQEWEAARQAGAPRHRVRIRTIAGASAGAITGALGVVALRRGLFPVPLTAPERAVLQGTSVAPADREAWFQSTRCVLPSLYEAWVTRPRMVAASGSGATDLLGTDDLKPDVAEAGGKKRRVVRSLLNAGLLDEIATAAMSYPGFAGQERVAPTGSDGAARAMPFLSDTMHVFMTLTNLRGIPFDVRFGQGTYGMLTHGDRVHYTVRLGEPPAGVRAWTENAFLKADQTMSLDAAMLPAVEGQPIPDPWKLYGLSAIASGAFPGGLAPRLITMPFAKYVRRQYPVPVTCGDIEPRFPAPWDPRDDFAFLAVDGGVVNNNPFDFVEYALWDRKEERRTGREADRAVIMVAPFPEPPTFLAAGNPQPELGSVIRALLPTLLNQARFRSSELGAALNKDDRSRFLISPERSLNNGPRERYPIACGLLGGFGGFLDESFRAHDYQLGRRNCQNFLASVFSLPPDATAIDVGDLLETARAKSRNGDYYDAHGKEFMIVPLIADAKREVGLPPWPQMSGSDFRILMGRVAQRFHAIRGPLVDAQVQKAEFRAALRMLLFLGRRRILNVIELTILADLVRRNQIKNWNLPTAVIKLTNQAIIGRQTDDVRLILASLVGPATLSAKACDIATATHLDPTFVKDVLDAFAKLDTTEPFGVVKDFDETYRLRMHVPTGIRALPLVGSLIERFYPQGYRYA